MPIRKASSSKMISGLPYPDGPSMHCSILVVDIVGFGRRDDDIHRLLRAELYRVLERAFGQSDVGWHACDRCDRGDGALIIIPARFPTIRLVNPLIGNLRAGLRHHNELFRESARIQLRVALHVGQVQSDSTGLSGSAIIHTFRLLEATALRQALIQYHAELALIASDYVYNEILRWEDDRTAYRPVDVQVKETAARAWLHIPGVIPGSLAPTSSELEVPRLTSVTNAEPDRELPADLHNQAQRRLVGPSPN